MLNYKFFTISFILLWLSTWLVSCENDINEIKSLDKRNVNIETAKDLTMLMTEGGHIKAKLIAPLMTRSTEDSAVTDFPNSVKVYFYDDSARVQSKVFAKKGKYVVNTGRVYLKDSVIITTMKKDTLKTSELTCDRNINLMHTRKQVWVHQMQPEEKYIHARGGLDATLRNMNNYTLYKVQKGSFVEYTEAMLSPKVP